MAEEDKQAETETQMKSSEDVAEEEELYFPNARVVRLIREENPKKMVKRRVKVEMNKLLEQIGRNISKELAKKPYASITYSDFMDAARPYLEMNKISQERRKVIATLEKIKADADFLSVELQEKSEEDNE